MVCKKYLWIWLVNNFYFDLSQNFTGEINAIYFGCQIGYNFDFKLIWEESAESRDVKDSIE